MINYDPRAIYKIIKIAWNYLDEIVCQECKFIPIPLTITNIEKSFTVFNDQCRCFLGYITTACNYPMYSVKISIFPKEIYNSETESSIYISTIHEIYLNYELMTTIAESSCIATDKKPIFHWYPKTNDAISIMEFVKEYYTN